MDQNRATTIVQMIAAIIGTLQSDIDELGHLFDEHGIDMFDDAILKAIGDLSDRQEELSHAAHSLILFCRDLLDAYPDQPEPDTIVQITMFLRLAAIVTDPLAICRTGAPRDIVDS